eukprot:353578-Chlamydomonas_euryale.AAC.13
MPDYTSMPGKDYENSAAHFARQVTCQRLVNRSHHVSCTCSTCSLAVAGCWALLMCQCPPSPSLLFALLCASIAASSFFLSSWTALNSASFCAFCARPSCCNSGRANWDMSDCFLSGARTSPITRAHSCPEDGHRL